MTFVTSVASPAGVFVDHGYQQAFKSVVVVDRRGGASDYSGDAGGVVALNGVPAGVLEALATAFDDEDDGVERRQRPKKRRDVDGGGGLDGTNGMLDCAPSWRREGLLCTSIEYGNTRV